MLALGVHGMTVITAVTAQNSVGVQGYWELPPEAVQAQLDSVLGDIGVQAIKTGMLASAQVVRIVASTLATVSAPVVVDPVAVSKHGDSLLSPGTLDALKAELLPLATIVTPNLHEAELLCGGPIDDEAGMLAAARQIAALRPGLGAREGRASAWESGRCALRRGRGRIGCPISGPQDRQPAHSRHRMHAGVSDRLVPRYGSGDAPGRRVGQVIRDRRDRRRIPAWRGNRASRSCLADSPAGQRVTLPALMQDVQTFSRFVCPRPWRARAECSGSSGAGCGGASATHCCRSPAPCRTHRRRKPRDRSR